MRVANHGCSWCSSGPKASWSSSSIIDTGFDGALCVPRPLAGQGALHEVGTQRAELADGSQHVEPLFLGEVVFDGARQWVDISVTQGSEALLGTALLGRVSVPCG